MLFRMIKQIMIVSTQLWTQNLIIRLTILMDQKSRLLPHLNLCYMQKKAYEIHRRKIDHIKHSLRNSRMALQNNNQHSQQPHSKTTELKPKYQLNTIKEELKAQLDSRLSPLAKRRQLQSQKQNTRLLIKISKCTSTINRKQIRLRSLKNQQIMQRLCKFKRSPTSKKTLLKCQQSLSHLMHKKQSNKVCHKSISCSLSRQPSNMQRSNSVAPTSFDDSLRNLRFRSFSVKKDRSDRFMIERNSRKIKSYFDEGKTLQKERVRIQSLRSSFDWQVRTFQNATGNSSKTRCFTTQPSLI